jgi:hypothetical protein
MRLKQKGEGFEGSRGAVDMLGGSLGIKEAGSREEEKSRKEA